jgi:Flp pilus assembly protein TadG
VEIDMGGAGGNLRISAVVARLTRFCRDRSGIAAIEFAFKKVSRIGSMVADLVTQQQSVLSTDLDAIMAIGNSTLQPYNRSSPKIIITAIQISTDATPKVQVVWSRKLVSGTTSVDAAAGTTTTVPTSLNVAGTFLIRVESDLAYQPMI